MKNDDKKTPFKSNNKVKNLKKSKAKLKIKTSRKNILNNHNSKNHSITKTVIIINLIAIV